MPLWSAHHKAGDFLDGGEIVGAAAASPTISGGSDAGDDSKVAVITPTGVRWALKRARNAVSLPPWGEQILRLSGRLGRWAPRSFPNDPLLQRQQG